MAVICNVPQVRDIREAVKLYYEKTELTTSDIMGLFDCKRTKAQRLKAMAREAQAEKQIKVWDAQAVNTKTAFLAWGLQIREMEDRLGAMQRLRLNG